MASGPIDYVIEESGPRGDTVRLTGQEVPHGGPRDTAGWNEGLETQIADGDGTRFPGSEKVVYHVMTFKPLPRTIKGQFRDHLSDGNGNVLGKGNARSRRDQITAIQKRARKVHVSWAGESFDGILHKTNFGVEGQYDITYEISFLVSATSQSPAKKVVSKSRTLVPDLIDQMLAWEQAQLKELAALRINYAVRRALFQAAKALDDALSAASDIVAAASMLTVGTVRAVEGYVLKQVAAAKKIQDQARAFAKAFDGLQAEVNTAESSALKVLFSDSASDHMAWASWSSDTLVGLKQMEDDARSMQAQFRQQLLQAGTVYMVNKGDTADSIAQAQLGSTGRAEEISAQVMRPNQTIRLPPH